jgi:hypothetical protein
MRGVNCAGRLCMITRSLDGIATICGRCMAALTGATALAMPVYRYTLRMRLFLHLHYNSAERGCHGGERDAGAPEIFTMLSRGGQWVGRKGRSPRGRLFARPHGEGAQKKPPYSRVRGSRVRQAPRRRWRGAGASHRGPAHHHGMGKWGRRRCRHNHRDGRRCRKSR